MTSLFMETAVKSYTRRILLTLVACLAFSQASPAGAAGMDESWRVISLPNLPMNIAPNGNTLWVCGTDEMIAVSKDAGGTWILKHQKADGEVLLSIVFSDQTTGFAAGSHGTVLKTEDGGETWSKTNWGTETIWNLAFSDSRNGLINTESGVKISHDAGASWNAIGGEESRKDIPKPRVAGLAMVDANHAAALYRGESSEPLVVSTEDGGATWNAEFFHSSGLWALMRHGSEFWMFGYEVIEKDKPGGGYGVALALHSKDARHWTHGIRAPNEFSACTAQGCILWDGAIVELFGEKPTFRAVPANGNLTSTWGSAGNTVCSIGSALRCASAAEVQVPPARPHLNRPSSGSNDPYLGSASPLDQACLRCPLAPFALDKKYLAGVPATVNLPGGKQQTIMMPGLRAVVELEYMVRKDGTIGETRVKDSPNKEIQSALTEVMKCWVMIPPRDGDVQRETKRKVKLAVSCMSFPSNDEGLCTPLVK